MFEKGFLQVTLNAAIDKKYVVKSFQSGEESRAKKAFTKHALEIPIQKGGNENDND